MKASILTFHCATNYGAVLQTFALQEILKQYVEEVEIIDYRPKYLINPYKLINTNNIRSIVGSMYNLPRNIKKKNNFKKFSDKYISLGQFRYKVGEKEIKNNSDILFLGSDQIWNLELTNKDSSYWGEVNNLKETICASYAASIGSDSVCENYIHFMKEKMKSLDAISVRESNAQKILNCHTDKNIEVVLDPTLLLIKEDWNEKVSNSYKKTSKYILLYSICGYRETLEVAQSVAKKYGYELIEIGTKKSKEKHKVIYDAGPSEFIDLFRNAEYIVTDSFHGTTFSIIFNKQFSVVPHKTKGSRMRSLLELLDLSNRIIENMDNMNLELNIDYKYVNEILQNERNKSINYIEDVIKLVEVK